MSTALSGYPLVKSPEKLDAAQTLLEATKFRSSIGSNLSSSTNGCMNNVTNMSFSYQLSDKPQITHGFTSFTGSWDNNALASPKHFSSSALDALAALASTERHLKEWSSSDEDSESMPPPPPRRRGRMRSVSNPEGMEKWDSYGHSSSRYHFVLPRSILEQELASVQSACLESENRNELSYPMNSIDTSDLDEVLKEARSRLAEDLSDNSDNKGSVLLPHLLEKYKEIYNKNGRIGIYTPDERAAIITKFNMKRARRVWNKKIRYDCRKNLADRRLRVKGRFVKRSQMDVEDEIDHHHHHKQEKQEQQEALASPSSCFGFSALAPVQEDEGHDSEEEKEDSGDGDGDGVTMVKLQDHEAGFIPTRDQPYRRVRRYTIT